MDALESIDHVTEGIVAFEDFAAEAFAGDLNLLGERDFLIAGEEWYLAHLGKVHADGIVDAAAVSFFLDKAQVQVAQLDFRVAGGLARRRAGLALFRFGLVD